MSAFIDIMCPVCGSSFKTYPAWLRRGRGKYCSVACSNKAHEKSISKRDDGYISVKLPSHHRANKWGYVYEHVLVAESKIGRNLNKLEVVHHINGDPSDNTPENLMVCKNTAQHRIEHAKKRISDAGGNPDTDKICHKCKRVLPKSSFTSTSSRGKRCLASACKQCCVQYQRERRAHVA